VTTTLRRRALACLREGRVTILHAEGDDFPNRADVAPDRVVAAVQSSRTGGPRYAVDLMPRDGWSCTCDRPDCPHIAAVQIVAGQAARVPS